MIAQLSLMFTQNLTMEDPEWWVQGALIVFITWIALRLIDLFKKKK